MLRERQSGRAASVQKLEAANTQLDLQLINCARMLSMDIWNTSIQGT